MLPLGFDTYEDDPISVLKVDLDAYRHIGSASAAETADGDRAGRRLQHGVIGPALENFLRGLAEAQGDPVRVAPAT